MAKELEILLGSKARPKVLNLFFQDREGEFTSKDVAKKCQIAPKAAKTELEKMQKIHLLLRKKQKKFIYYNLNLKFPFLPELRNMVINASPISFGDAKRVFKKVLRVKLLFLSGEFLKERKSPVDVLFVGDNISQNNISKAIKKIESDIGKELRWTAMNLKEFNYRFNINDRFLGDILSRKNKIIINKIRWSGNH